MKKSHPLRHRILAARRARKDRTLAARRLVEFQAALLAFRRSAVARPRWTNFAAFVEMQLRTCRLADVVERLREGRTVKPEILAGLGIVRMPPGVRTLTYTAANLRRA